MKTFIADIIPKIKRYSKKLDDLTLLTNQHWVVLEELNQSKTVYIFRDNNELLISRNGKVEKAKWEYLGHDSILIDLKEESYLFRHGFLDENVLALKFDSKDEYAVLVNESKYGTDLNSITSVLSFLDKKYLLNYSQNNLLEQSVVKITDMVFLNKEYTFKMGSFKKFMVRISTGDRFIIYRKSSNDKYFVYANDEIISFKNLESCVKYIAQ